MDVQSSHTSIKAAPDWSAISEQITCPLCEYNLRGIAEPRCPECGYGFFWSELLDPQRRAHSRFFEHQAHHRWRAFRRTAVAGLMPGRFWREVSPGQPSFPKRLVLYWLMWLGVALAGHVALFAYGIFLDLSGYPLGAYGAEKLIVPFVLNVVVIVFWPPATIAALCVFQFSMFRAKIRESHILRCVLYSADCFLWIGLLLLVNTPACAALALIRITPDIGVVALPLLLLPLFMVIAIYRLIRAYQLYMRFDHVIATVLCAQIIALLLLLVCSVAVPILLH